jgi:transcription elongation GreA/GreB family factor
MATYRLSIINEHFADTADLKATDVVRAWQEAIKTAIIIAADQISHGSPFFGAEVRLEEGKTLVGRYVVSVGATPLKD